MHILSSQLGDVAHAYVIQLSENRSAVWIHCQADGSTVGRFGRMGMDMHNTVTQQMSGMPECRLCTHGKPSLADWDQFRHLAKAWWGVEVPPDAFSERWLLG